MCANKFKLGGESYFTALGMLLILGVCQAVRADTVYQTTAKNLSGLVAYYTFDGVTTSSTTLADDSGNSHAGTFTTGTIGVSSDTAGVGSGQSLAFDTVSGNSASVNGISETGFPTSNAARSAVFWLKNASRTTANASWEGIFEFGTPGAGHHGEAFHAGLSYDYPGQVFTGQYGAAVHGRNVSDSLWHMITVTVDNTGLDAGQALFSVYVDGSTTPDGTGVLSTNTELNNNGLIGNSYLGNVDELAYYNRVLTTGEMGSLYSAMTIPEPSSVILLVTGVLGLLAYAWRKRK